MMEIVIDIPEGMVKALEQGCFGAKYNIYDLCGCVMNGTPLPKGHGRVGDLDALYQEIETKGWFDSDDAYYGGGLEDIVLSAPTLIEADKGE